VKSATGSTPGAVPSVSIKLMFGWFDD